MQAKEIITRINKGEKINVIDIRQKERYDVFHIPNAIWSPKGEMFETPEKYINKKSKWYITCNSGRSAGMVVDFLKSKGFDVENVENGMNPILNKTN